MFMKKHLRLLVALVVLLAGSALASAHQVDGGDLPPICHPGVDCVLG
jgi:hypothetical protein